MFKSVPRRSREKHSTWVGSSQNGGGGSNWSRIGSNSVLGYWVTLQTRVLREHLCDDAFWWFVLSFSFSCAHTNMNSCGMKNHRLRTQNSCNGSRMWKYASVNETVKTNKNIGRKWNKKVTKKKKSFFSSFSMEVCTLTRFFVVRCTRDTNYTILSPPHLFE